MATVVVPIVSSNPIVLIALIVIPIIIAGRAVLIVQKWFTMA